MHLLSFRIPLQRLRAIAALALLLSLIGCGDFFVDPGALVAIAVIPNNATIQPAKTQQFTATATLGDGTTKDVSAQSTWTSSLPAIATINSTGLATGVAIGTTTISATSGGVTGSANLIVSNQIINSLALTPANPTLVIGQTQQFTATATLSDNTIRDVTSSVVWASSNPAIASVSNTGLATALTAGSTTISATSGTVTASTNLTVTSF